MKNNIVPIIESIDDNKLVPSAKTVYRNCIMLVIKHPTENKFLYLHNKKFGWNVLELKKARIHLFRQFEK